MIIAARAIGLVLFGLAMIGLEFRAFSAPWSWTLAQDLFVLVGLSVMFGMLRAKQRRLQDGGGHSLLISESSGGRARLRDLLRWIIIFAVLVALYRVFARG